LALSAVGSLLAASVAAETAAGPHATAALVFGLSALQQATRRALEAGAQPEAQAIAQTVADLEAAVAADPADGTARLLLGLAYSLQGETGKGAEALRASRLADRPPGAELLRLAGVPGEAIPLARLTQALDQAAAEVAPRLLVFDRAPPWQARLTLSLGADSNPNLLADEFLLTAPDGRQVDGGTSDQVAEGALRLEARPFFDRRGWSLAVAGEASRSVHGELGYLDLTSGRLHLLLARGSDPKGFLDGPLGFSRVPWGRRRLALLLQGGGSWYLLGGESYLRAAEVAVSARLGPGESAAAGRRRWAAATQLDLSFRNRDYPAAGAADPERSGGELGLKLGERFDFSRGRYLRLAVEAAQADAGRPYAGSALGWSAAAGLPVGARWALELHLRGWRDRYDHPESDLFSFDPMTGAGAPRRDTTESASASLHRALPAGLELWLVAAATRRDSNVEASGGRSLDYDRVVFRLEVAWSLGGRP
jgi:hypothetical protein